MPNFNKSFLPFALLLSPVLIWGCGSKRIVNTEVPQQPGAVQTAKTQALSSSHYLVQKEDCLWEIAGKNRIYGDPFQWPMLFKANRDEIQDPDLIYPRQDLLVQKGFSPEERSEARKLAMATPKYVPHSKPRETLPLNYF